MVYIISALSWGAVLLKLSSTIVHLLNNKEELPSTLIPLTIASLATLINSVYFGFASLFNLLGYNGLFLSQFNGSYWFIVMILTAVSGVMMLFNLRGLNKK